MKATIECPNCGIGFDVELVKIEGNFWEIMEDCPNCGEGLVISVDEIGGSI